MINLLILAGSFATFWLTIWFASSLLLLFIYPVVRRLLFSWHPKVASRLHLLLLSFPFLLSLSTTIMLFVPVLENRLVSAHCHANCASHIPLIHSPLISGFGLALSAIILVAVIYKLILNITTVKRLMSQLTHLGTECDHWVELPDSQSIVFTLGWWQNRVFITEGLLRQCSDNDIDIILRHENAHMARHDNLRLLLARMFLFVLPEKLNEQLYADLHFLTESACDYAAAEEYGTLNVADALLRIQKLVPKQFDYRNQQFLSAFTGSEVELRIRSLASGANQFKDIQFGQTAFVLILILASFALVDPMHHGIEWLLELH